MLATDSPLIKQRPTRMSKTLCQCCGAGEMMPFYEMRSVPANSCVLLRSREEAQRFPRGDIILAFCDQCGFISNTAFDSRLTEYSSRYEETQAFSGTFDTFHRRLAQRLVKSHNLYNKTIIEIGCGKGEFLSLLCELGGNRGVGFDPGFDDQREKLKGSRKIKFIKDFYSDRYTDSKSDFVCCKMTLEHIYNASDFVNLMKGAIKEDKSSIVFIQVPETTRILRDIAFEDIYYEHCSYFTPGSLARLFRRHGFDILDLSTEYQGQYLAIEAQLVDAPNSPLLSDEDDLIATRKYVHDFSRRYQQKIHKWNDQLKELSIRGKTVLWGSGSKAVAFLSTFQLSDEIEFVVDINPYRQNHYMPGTGQQIVAPEFLKDYLPSNVVVMNRVYLDEVRKDLDRLGLKPELLAL